MIEGKKPWVAGFSPRVSERFYEALGEALAGFKREENLALCEWGLPTQFTLTNLYITQ